MMSLKLQPCAFIQLEEASVAELQQQGGGGWREGEWRGSQRTASLTLGHEFSLLQLPQCTETESEGTGPVDTTAMTYGEDCTLDCSPRRWWHWFIYWRSWFRPVPKCCHWAKCTPEQSPGVVTTIWVLRYELEMYSSTVTFLLLFISVCFDLPFSALLSVKLIFLLGKRRCLC